MSVTTLATIASFGGKLLKLSHKASTTGCEMKFNLYLPPQATTNSLHKVPLFIWLSGLTCTADNCSEKGFFQHGASKKGIAILYPDTSPRGVGIQGEDDSWDFGTGAGFYVDATASPWSNNYKMYSYITEELPKTVFENFDQIDSSRVSISGHSMGGHGALSLYLKNPGKYKSVSAFAPIANPLKCPWGEKAFKGYFGESDWQKKGAQHDSTELLKQWKGGDLDILIDVGTGDNFYKQGQLLPENFIAAAKEIGQEKGVKVRFQPDYDHSYYTMATFSDDHINHAAKYLFAYGPQKHPKL
ncbi:S-formylglutathione hydrolase [Exophiala dermatitidis]